MRMAAPARTACWRMTLQANASSSGCGAISINLERLSNVEAVKVRNDTVLNRRESKTAGNLIQLSGEVIPLDRSETAFDGLRPKDHEVDRYAAKLKYVWSVCSTRSAWLGDSPQAKMALCAYGFQLVCLSTSTIVRVPAATRAAIASLGNTPAKILCCTLNASTANGLPAR